MDLFKVIEEQSAFGFSGNINILDATNNQYVGAVILKDGKIVNARIDDRAGEIALFALISLFEGESGLQLKCVVEPELVSEEQVEMDYTPERFIEICSNRIAEYREGLKFRPPDSLRFLLKGEFVVSGEMVTSEEFDIMTLISDYALVSDIYRQSPLSELDVTRLLVSLRKKGALKVVGAP